MMPGRRGSGRPPAWSGRWPPRPPPGPASARRPSTSMAPSSAAGTASSASTAHRSAAAIACRTANPATEPVPHATWSDKEAEVEPVRDCGPPRRRRPRPPPASRPRTAGRRAARRPCRSPGRRRGPRPRACRARRRRPARSARPRRPWPRCGRASPRPTGACPSPPPGSSVPCIMSSGVEQPRHDPLVGVDVGGGDVAVGPEQRRDLEGVAAGEPLELADRQSAGGRSARRPCRRRRGCRRRRS